MWLISGDLDAVQDAIDCGYIGTKTNGVSCVAGTDENEIYCGIVVGREIDSNGGSRDEWCSIEDFDVPDFKEKLKNTIIAEFGEQAWKDSQFGLWAVLYCSY